MGTKKNYFKCVWTDKRLGMIFVVQVTFNCFLRITKTQPIRVLLGDKRSCHNVVCVAGDKLPASNTSFDVRRGRVQYVVLLIYANRRTHHSFADQLTTMCHGVLRPAELGAKHQGEKMIKRWLQQQFDLDNYREIGNNNGFIPSLGIWDTLGVNKMGGKTRVKINK